MEPVAQPSEVFARDLLAGHVAIVTGGGTNLGKAAAAELVALRGACRHRGPARGRARADACAEIGPHCTWVSGDIRVPADCERIVDVALERHGRVDTLLNNAGGQYFAPAEAITEKGWAAVMAAERRRDAADDAARASSARCAPAAAG